VASGGELFQQYACNTCHEKNDTGRGPSLYGIADSDVQLVGGGSAVRDDNYLREAILRPAARLVDGYPNLMPTYQGQISEEGVSHLIAYIKSLDADSSDPAVVADATTADSEAAAAPAGGENTDSSVE
jgi:cytochrome c oxidase subunit 2